MLDLALRAAPLLVVGTMVTVGIGVVSRHVLCHLTEPAGAFAAWRQWPKCGSHVFVAAGLWRRSARSDPQLEGQPFAAPSDARPVADALAKAGFAIIEARPGRECDEARRTL